MSKGAFPADFLLSTNDKYTRDRQQVDMNQTRHDRMMEDFFYRDNDYFIDEIRFNGELLINDTITRYLNSICDDLLKDQPEVRKSITICAMHSSAVNAFSTLQGLICVNLGLVARINNRAELAFVIAHEIIHYLKKHTLVNYLKLARTQRSNDNSEDDITRSHRYSRASESEADSLGLILYLKAGYPGKSALDAMDMLAYAAYAPLQSSIDLSLFEDKYLMIPDVFIRAHTVALVPDYGDKSNSTHPGIDLRKKQLTSMLQDMNGNDSVVSDSSAFTFYKNVALFECASLYNNEGDFQRAAYHCLTLLSVYPGNLYLQKELARACYGVTIFRDRFSTPPQRNMKGNEELLNNFVWSQSASATGTAFLKYIWRIHLAHPDDRDLQYYVYGIICDLTRMTGYSLEDLYRSDSSVTAVVSHLRAGDSSLTGKTDEALFAKWVNDSSNKDASGYYLYAFIGMLDDTLLSAMNIAAQGWSKGDTALFNGMLDRIAGGPRIKNVTGLEPFTLSLNIGRHSDDEVNFLKMDHMRKDLAIAVRNSYRATGHPIAVMDRDFLVDTSTCLFNDMYVVTGWVHMKDLLGDSTMPFLPYSLTTICGIERKYEASYLVNTAFFHSKESIEREPYNYALFFFIPALPQSLWIAFKPRFRNYCALECYDLRTGQNISVQTDRMDNQAYHRGMASVHIYNLIRELSILNK